MSDIKTDDTRKSLIVLPFEDLSPAGEENEWFADGLAGEMIDALSHVKALRVLDRNTSSSLKKTKLRTVEIGKEFNTRHFIEGSVRKSGDQINIVMSLLDVETGEHLWRDFYRGEFKDIFDIQESVAEKVVEGMKLHLSREERTMLQERGTDNAEAYSFLMKANEFSNRLTKEGTQFALQLLDEAIKLDPGYANAYRYKANALASIFYRYDQDPQLLVEGRKLVKEALRLKPDLFEAYQPLSLIYFLQGDLKAAEEAAKEAIRLRPTSSSGYYALGYFYNETEQYAKAIAPYEQAVKLEPDNLAAIRNLILACEQANDKEKLRYWSQVALQQFDRHLKLFPDDESKRVARAHLLHHVGRDEEARAALKLDDIGDGSSLYNAAVILCTLKDYPEGIKAFRKSMEAGMRNLIYLKHFLVSGTEDFNKLMQTPEYLEVKRMVEQIEADQLASVSPKESNA